MTYTLKPLHFFPQRLRTEEAFAQYELVRVAQYQLAHTNTIHQFSQFMAVVE